MGTVVRNPKRPARERSMQSRTALSTVAAAVLLAAPVSSPTAESPHPAKRDPEGTIVLFDPPRVLAPEVTFLSRAPRIDGELDRDLEDLPVREFSRIWKSDPGNPAPPAHYRLAYGTDFLYAYVEAEAERLTYRDRAYQNGDGFALVIAAARPDDEPTENFYVLACSAVNKESQEWCRRIFWYYDVDQIFVRTSDQTKLEFREGGGKISFELILPWRDVHPFHPWISGGIGFNLQFTQAIGEEGRNRYKVAPGTVGAENSPRWYRRLEFQTPRLTGKQQTFVSTTRGNVEEGEPIHGIAVTVAPGAVSEELRVTVQGQEGGSSRDIRPRFPCRPGVTRNEFEVVPAGWAADDYALHWQSRAGRGEGELTVTVLPRFDPPTLRKKLADAAAGISPGSLRTLEFNVERAERLLAELPAYEVASLERQTVTRVQELMDRAARGEDPYVGRTGLFRRAFRSEMDGTLQPYCVRVPADYDPSRTYPLLVFLHGSASTETDIAGKSFLSSGGIIEVAPFGRGPSNGFATRDAQTDIAEAIEDAVANYPIDRGRVVLTGFSMGGYGALRTYWETPEKFQALAVFSGGTRFGANSIDFLAEDLARFEGLPVFLYHGEEDRNVSFDRAREVAERLRAAGAKVEFYPEPGKGHEMPGKDAVRAYHDWLREVIGLP
jgi:predicted esterase